ncbi:hypothetical protein ACNKHX_10910 [Shigella flexneri]
MTTIHAETGTQLLVDGPRGKDLRASRAAAEISFPTLRGGKSHRLVIPGRSGKLKVMRNACRRKQVGHELVSILGKKRLPKR